MLRGETLAFFLFAFIVMIEVTASNRCRGGFDLYFVLDKSTSVNNANFKSQTVSFVEKIVSRFVSKHLRVSFITFSSSAQVVMGLTDNRTMIAAGLHKLREVKTGGDTHMDLGITEANKQIKKLGEKTAGVVIALTDGHITNRKEQTFRAAQESRLYGASVYAVGVDNYEEDELQKIADKPSKDHVFVAKNYEALQNIIDSIITKSCIEVISAEPTRTCAGGKDNFLVTLYGNGFTKTDNISKIRCNFKLGMEDHISKPLFVNTSVIKCLAPPLPSIGSKLNIHVSVNSVKYVSSDVFIEGIDCKPRIKNVSLTELCAGRKAEIEVSGKLLVRGGIAERPNVACRVVYNNTFKDPSRVISLTTSTMKCQIGASFEIGRTINFEVTSPNYEIVYKNVPLTIVSCVRTKEQVNVSLIVGIIFAFFLLGLLLFWWFWLLLFPKPKKEPVSPTSSTGPPKSKWPSVDTSYYGGGGVGGISPVQVKWGDKGATDAGALLAVAKGAKRIKDTPSSSSEEPKPSCWDVTKGHLVSFFMIFPNAYRWLASRRPQRGGKGGTGEEYMQVRAV